MVNHTISNDFEYTVFEIVDGFNAGQRFFHVFGMSREKNDKGWSTQVVIGYLPIRTVG